MRVGLTGGIGSGKSTVAEIFADLGAYVVDTDVIAREVVAPQSDGLLEVARLWPAVVRDGVLDRAALADIVFTDAHARAQLNAALHPHIRRRALEREAQARSGQIIVHVVPLLFETGYDALVDKSVLVVAPLERRVARIVERDRIDEARVRARVAAQIDPAFARERADYAIENDDGIDRLRHRTREIFDSLNALLRQS